MTLGVIPIEMFCCILVKTHLILESKLLKKRLYCYA
jgi:hypothetical protein